MSDSVKEEKEFRYSHWNATQKISWDELVARLKNPTQAPEIQTYASLPQSLRMGTFHKRGKELLELSRQDEYRRERMIAAKIDISKRLVTPLASAATIGEKPNLNEGHMSVHSQTNLYKRSNGRYQEIESIAAYIHDHPHLPGEIYPDPPSPLDISVLFKSKSWGELPLSLVCCEGVDSKGRPRNYVLVKTLETTEMSAEDALSWSERMTQQVRERTKAAQLRRENSFVPREFIFKTEETRFVLQACQHHKIGVFVNTEADSDEYVRSDLVDLKL